MSEQEIEKVEELLESDEYEICGVQDIEMMLQQLNIDCNLLAGVYIYAASDGKIQVSQVGLPNHCEILEQEYVKWSLNKNSERSQEDAN